ncbi:MAG: hypothetical protein B7Z74_06040, partial [Deltaproteobacteria bacterium 21-66-5]
MRVDSIILPPPAETAAQPLLSPALPALAPNQIAATVTGTGTDGQLILKAGDAVLFVKAQATAPVGATVIATVDAPPPEPLLPLPQNAPVNFQALPQAMAALAQSDPQTLMQMVAAHLPQPTQGLPGALLFLFSAFKQGDVGGWLGGNTVASLLRAGKPD